MKKFWLLTLSLALAIILGFAHPAEANYPIYQMSYLVQFLSAGIFQTMGLGLLVVVLIETLVLRRMEKLSFPRAFSYSFVANLFSTVLGVASSPGISAMFLFPMLLIGSAFLAKMTRTIALHGQYKMANRPKLLVWMAYFTFMAMGFLVFKFIDLTVPGGKNLVHAQRIYFANDFEVFIAVISAFGLLAIGYLITVVSEGYAFTKLFPKGHRFIKTLLVMNLFSYLALVVLLSPNIASVIKQRAWWFHWQQEYNLRGDLKNKANLVLYESVTGDWTNVINSVVDTLEDLGYGIERVWPDDKFQKRFKEIGTMYSSLDESKRKANFPTSIQVNINRENEQTNDMKLEIVLNSYETDDGYRADLQQHTDSGCLSGPIKAALIESFTKNGFSKEALECTTGRWTIKISDGGESRPSSQFRKQN